MLKSPFYPSFGRLTSTRVASTTCKLCISPQFWTFDEHEVTRGWSPVGQMFSSRERTGENNKRLDNQTKSQPAFQIWSSFVHFFFDIIVCFMNSESLFGIDVSGRDSTLTAHILSAARMCRETLCYNQQLSVQIHFQNLHWLQPIYQNCCTSCRGRMQRWQPLWHCCLADCASPGTCPAATSKKKFRVSTSWLLVFFG